VDATLLTKPKLIGGVSCDFQLVEHVIDDHIEVIGLLKAAMCHHDRNLSEGSIGILIECPEE
jgi:hypothetical protein